MLSYSFVQGRISLKQIIPSKISWKITSLNNNLRFFPHSLKKIPCFFLLKALHYLRPSPKQNCHSIYLDATTLHFILTADLNMIHLITLYWFSITQNIFPGMPTSKLRKLYSESQKSVFFHKNLYFLIWCQISLLNLNPRVNCKP